ncbi:MAG: 3'(2'),5'-bisphosphate nucleotidase CysQ [Candidatus Marinimicrobia bacterium]|jgi:3'(2'), 5'-bisphosphate nucleotidase|nr:3'(2'),5'-bisphosphate nucleotidase CysQ [Candidatus Neomarinimicrobiota bacterium]
MIEKIIEISKKAGKETLKYYNDNVKIEYKDDNSPLTQADLVSHRIIVDFLEKLTPKIPIISEEGEIPEYNIRKKWMKYWLIDPLDGTKEFIKKNGEYTINIALIIDREPVVGVIYVPVTDIFYYGEKNKGSFKIENGETKRIFANKIDENSPLTVIESRSHPSKELEKYLQTINVKDRVQVGSSLKFCLVAEGLADIYPRLSPTMEWDTGVGDCIYRNAAMGKENYSPIIYNKPILKNKNFIIANFVE